MTSFAALNVSRIIIVLQSVASTITIAHEVFKRNDFAALENFPFAFIASGKPRGKKYKKRTAFQGGFSSP